jgi:hypothetical protein
MAMRKNRERIDALIDAHVALQREDSEGMDTYEQVAESLRIEGITRPPTDEEITEHRRFMRLKTLSISELEAFLKIYRPGACLRLRSGQNIRVGPHVPPKGGEHILMQLHAFYLQTLNNWGTNVETLLIHSHLARNA